MHGWTPEQWVFVIGGSLSALGSLIATVIDAVKSNNDRAILQTQVATLHRRLDQHEANSEVRAVAISGNLPQVAPNKGGDALETPKVGF